MIDKTSILKMTKHVFRKSRGHKDRRLMHPQREWFIGVFISILIVVIGSVATADLFSKYRNVDLIEGDASGSIPQYKEEVVKNTLELYRVRKAEYTRLQNIKAPVVIEASPSTVNSTEVQTERIKENITDTLEVE